MCEQYIETMELKAKKKEDAFVEAAVDEKKFVTAALHESWRNNVKSEKRPRRQPKHARRRISASSGLWKP